MLPYLSFPVYSCVVLFCFNFIEGGVGYLPFKKKNRKFKTPGNGGKKSVHKNRALVFGVKKPYSPHIPSCSHPSPAMETLEFLPLVRGLRSRPRKTVWPCEGWHSVCVLNGAKSGRGLEINGHGHLMKMCGRWLSGKILSLDHPYGSFA